MKKKSKSNKKYHILTYTLNSTPKMKRFDSTKEMGDFIDKFNKKHPDYAAIESGDWIDFAVTGITGDVHFFCDGIELE